MALLSCSKVAIRQVITNLLEGGIRNILGKQRDTLGAIRQVHILERAFLVSGQTIVSPTARVYIPLAFQRVRTDPER